MNTCIKILRHVGLAIATATAATAVIVLGFLFIDAVSSLFVAAYSGREPDMATIGAYPSTYAEWLKATGIFFSLVLIAAMFCNWNDATK